MRVSGWDWGAILWRYVFTVIIIVTVFLSSSLTAISSSFTDLPSSLCCFSHVFSLTSTSTTTTALFTLMPSLRAGCVWTLRGFSSAPTSGRGRWWGVNKTTHSSRCCLFWLPLSWFSPCSLLSGVCCLLPSSSIILSSSTWFVFRLKAYQSALSAVLTESWRSVIPLHARKRK